MCCGFCAREFGPKNFGFVTEDPWLIVSAQWPKFPCWLYVAWRVIASLYFLVWCILSGTQTYDIYDPPDSNRAKWFIYLTNWQYGMVTFALLGQAVVAVVCHSRRSLLAEGRVTWYLRFSWLMDTLANDLIFVVGLMFWALLYKPGSFVNAVDLHTHGITILYLTINLCISGTPIRSYHFIYSVIFGVVYIIFTVVYYHAGGLNPFGTTSIYRGIVDWVDPSTSALYVCIVAFVAIPVCHFILFGLYLLKMAIRYKGCNYSVGPVGVAGEKVNEGYDMEYVAN